MTPPTFLSEIGLSEKQAGLVVELSRSLLMSEQEFCKEVLMEYAKTLLSKPAILGEVVKDTLVRKYGYNACYHSAGKGAAVLEVAS